MDNANFVATVRSELAADIRNMPDSRDELKAIRDQRRKDAKQQLHDLVSEFGKCNVQNWLDDTVEYGGEA